MQSQNHAFAMTVFVVRSELLHIFKNEHSRAESADILQGGQIKPFAITTTKKVQCQQTINFNVMPQSFVRGSILYYLNYICYAIMNENEKHYIA